MNEAMQNQGQGIGIQAREKFWNERTESEKSEALYREVLHLTRQVYELTAQMHQLLQHQHASGGAIVTPIQTERFHQYHIPYPLRDEP